MVDNKTLLVPRIITFVHDAGNPILTLIGLGIGFAVTCRLACRAYRARILRLQHYWSASSKLALDAHDLQFETITFQIERGSDNNSATLVDQVRQIECLKTEIEKWKCKVQDVNKLIDNELALKFLIEEDAKCTVTSTSLLHLAAIAGHVEYATISLSKNANPRITSKSGASLIAIACWKNHHLIAKLLADHGADVNGQKGQAFCIHFAVAHGNIRLLNTLILHGVDTTILLPTNEDIVGFSIRSFLRDKSERRLNIIKTLLSTSRSQDGNIAFNSMNGVVSTSNIKSALRSNDRELVAIFEKHAATEGCLEEIRHELLDEEEATRNARILRDIEASHRENEMEARRREREEYD